MSLFFTAKPQNAVNVFIVGGVHSEVCGAHIVKPVKIRAARYDKVILIRLGKKHSLLFLVSGIMIYLNAVKLAV